MRSQHQPPAVGALFAMTAIVGWALAPGLVADSRAPENFIQRVVAQTTRAGLAIRATRELHAGTLSGKHEGWMTVETTLTPSGVFSWNIVREGGSDRTRDKVFRALLDGEADSWRDGSRTTAALSPANYEFLLLPATASGDFQIRVKPRRADPKLVDGILTVSADGYPLRLEGKLAKSPSFWVKSVTVTKRYGRFAGVALPVVLESEADLRLFGKSRFSMRYHYREVNGSPIRMSASTAEVNP